MMNKKIILITVGILAALGAAAFFYFGFHTYFITTEIDEPFPTMMPSETEEQTPPMEDPQSVAVGEFGEVDAIHKGSGQARLIDVGGQYVLRFENFSVTSGPDLYVYLSDSQNPTHNTEDLGNYVNLGRLKATTGNQNYDVPTGGEEYRTAVIWCEEFSVLFSFAVME